MDLPGRNDLHALQKVFVNSGFHSGERNGKKTNLIFCRMGKLFPSQLKPRLVKFQFSGISSSICWICLMLVATLDRF